MSLLAKDEHVTVMKSCLWPTQNDHDIKNDFIMNFSHKLTMTMTLIWTDAVTVTWDWWLRMSLLAKDEAVAVMNTMIMTHPNDHDLVNEFHYDIEL